MFHRQSYFPTSFKFTYLVVVFFSFLLSSQNCFSQRYYNFAEQPSVEPYNFYKSDYNAIYQGLNARQAQYNTNSSIIESEFKNAVFILNQISDMIDVLVEAAKTDEVIYNRLQNCYFIEYVADKANAFIDFAPSLENKDWSQGDTYNFYYKELVKHKDAMSSAYSSLNQHFIKVNAGTTNCY